MKNILNDITVVLVSYKSLKKIKKFVKKLPSTISLIIIENSHDRKIKEAFKNKKKIKIIFNKNNGYGSSINLASKKIKTNIFLFLTPM